MKINSINFCSKINNNAINFKSNLFPKKQLTKEEEEISELYKRAEKANIDMEYLDLYSSNKMTSLDTIKEVMDACIKSADKGAKINGLMINDFLFRGDVDTQKIQEILRVYQIARSEGKSYFPSEFSRTFLDNDIDTSKILTRQDYINALNEAGLSEIDLLTSFGEDYMLTVIRKVD